MLVVDFEVVVEKRQWLFEKGRGVVIECLQWCEVVNSVGHLWVTGGGFGVWVSSYTGRIESSGKSVDEGASGKKHSGWWEQ
jgi:hypothetical protein